MEFKSYLVKDYSIKACLEDMYEYLQLCYQYPLVFFEKSNSISFYSEPIQLDPKEYCLLFNLVIDKTESIKKNKYGISPKQLCRKIGYKPRNIITDEESYDIRITKYKSEILGKIKEKFKIYYSPDDKTKFSYKNITETIDEQKTLCGFKVDITSPYYNFNVDDCLKSLIYSSGKGKNKKYTTDFIFPL